MTTIDDGSADFGPINKFTPTVGVPLPGGFLLRMLAGLRCRCGHELRPDPEAMPNGGFRQDCPSCGRTIVELERTL